jgi:LPS export ABC transporter protein LptC
MGNKQALLDAEYLAVFDMPGNSLTRMDTLEVDFYDEDGAPTSHLTAESGEIYDQDREGQRRVKTWGDVVLVGSEGRMVRADTLWWDEEGDRLFTDGPVEVTREGELLRGTGFESDTRLENMRLFEGSGVSQRGGEWLEDERRADQESESDTTSAVLDTSSVQAVPDTTAAAADSLLQPALPDSGGIPPQ